MRRFYLDTNVFTYLTEGSHNLSHLANRLRSLIRGLARTLCPAMKTTEVKYPALMSAMKAYVHDAVRVIRAGAERTQDAQGPEIPEALQGAPVLGDSRALNLGQLFARVEPQLVRLQSFKRCSVLVQADPVLSKHVDELVGTERARFRLSVTRIVNWVLAALLMDFDAILAGNLNFHQEYEGFEQFFFSDEVEARVVLALAKFKTEPDPLELAPNLELAALSETEKHAVKSFAPTGRVFGEAPELGIRAGFSLPKIIGDPTPDKQKLSEERQSAAQERITQVAHALAAFKSGKFGSLGMVLNTPGFPSGMSYEYPAALLSRGGLPYSLSGEDRQLFKEFWAQLSTPACRQCKPLVLALRRFSYAKERSRAEDRLIDLMIAAEALFLSDVGNEKYRGELRYRLALRAGLFIGSSSSEAKGVFELFRNAYDARSAFVHGSSRTTPVLLKGERVGLEKFVERVEDRLRDAIRKAVRLSADGRTVRGVVDWDALLFSRLA